MLEDSEQTLRDARHAVQEQYCRLKGLSKQLSARRKKTIESFLAEVLSRLEPLGMPHAQLWAKFEPLSEIKEIGAEKVQLMFSANPGGEAMALQNVASGGEMSRLLLAIKSVLLKKDAALVTVFDEIDSGVSGVMGEAIGMQLRALGQVSQVLCVSHLPQVAAKAAIQYHVVKKVVQGQTEVTARRLNKDERTAVIARMMGGKDITKAGLEHAKEVLLASEV